MAARGRAAGLAGDSQSPLGSASLDVGHGSSLLVAAAAASTSGSGAEKEQQHDQEQERALRQIKKTGEISALLREESLFLKGDAAKASLQRRLHDKQGPSAKATYGLHDSLDEEEEKSAGRSHASIARAAGHPVGENEGTGALAADRARESTQAAHLGIFDLEDEPSKEDEDEEGDGEIIG